MKTNHIEHWDCNSNTRGPRTLIGGLESGTAKAGDCDGLGEGKVARGISQNSSSKRELIKNSIFSTVGHNGQRLFVKCTVVRMLIGDHCYSHPTICQANTLFSLR